MTLTNAEVALVDAANKVINAIPVKDNHSVAAAALSSDGHIFTGVNVHHFSGGPCAEAVVLGNVAAAGVWQLTHMVAVANEGRSVINPCGRCRQMLLDYHPGITVIVDAVDQGFMAVKIENLLPYAYRIRDSS